mmetsp:Transcript_23167/g.72330  ORF Transcript_23167/g.72330 Transcript_23167/m.72330 type:complete len:508 (+) Transcript_23167:5138-6661(+)
MSKFEEAELRWAQKKKTNPSKRGEIADRREQQKQALAEVAQNRARIQGVGRVVPLPSRKSVMGEDGVVMEVKQKKKSKRNLSPRRAQAGGATPQRQGGLILPPEKAAKRKAKQAAPKKPRAASPKPARAASPKPARVVAVGDEGDKVFDDPNKKWGELTRDWKLMGLGENESIDDALFMDLVERHGLRKRWRPMVSYLVSLGMTGSELEELSEKREELFSCGVSRARGRLDFLEKKLGFSQEEKKKMIVKNPRIVEYRIERTMQPRLDYLAGLGVSRQDLSRLILRAPSLLEVSVEDTMKPRVEWLMNTVGLSEENVGKVVARHPQVLTYDIDDMMQDRVDFLRQTVGVSSAGVATMVTKHPQILQYAPESMQPRLEYLQSIGMSEDQVVMTVTRLSQLFSLSVEDNLKPKYEYLTSELGGGVNTVTSYPAYFSLSLKQRIMPRHRILVELDRLPSTPFPMKWLAIKDVAFAEGVAQVDLRQYEDFRQQINMRDFASNFNYKNMIQA